MKEKYYLMKFRTGNNVHIGLSSNVHGFFTRPYAPCRDTIGSHAFPISKEMKFEDAYKMVTCKKCKELLQERKRKGVR